MCRYFGRLPIFRQSLLPNFMHRKARRFGPMFAEGRCVRRMVFSDGTIEQVEKLVGELRAISHWDIGYRRLRCPEWYETAAYVSRQERRSEIIRELIAVFSVPTKEL
jgi:hypothetical protein